MRIVFFGTPAFAVPSLSALLEGQHQVVGVVCQPDRPAGRGQRRRTPPVKELAVARAVPVAQPERLRAPDVQAHLTGWAPDLVVVAAYGRILPKSILDLPPYGCINVHASLLPKYRGAAPIQWAILCGESVTGVTIMRMNERMDEGDILLQRETRIGDQETYGELEARLALLGAATMQEVLPLLKAGRLLPQPQNHAAATLAPMIRKEDGRIDWAAPATEIARRVRAFNPWPSAYTHYDGKRLAIHRAHAEAAVAAAPSTIVRIADTIDVVSGAGTVAIEELQLEGRTRLTAREFARGRHLHVGARLG